ncbi:hypothetical protein [Thermoflexus sp.]|uniref:hypothetical protein n=1 Tax=Thermoflexus sp. TaxID=1969742 RepID=UPI0035E44AE6
MNKKTKAAGWPRRPIKERNGASFAPHYTPSLIKVNGRPVGEVRDGVFRKHVRASVHMLRRPPAWALDVESLADAERLGARVVEIVDVETGFRYRASVARIREKGFELDRGHGRQIALELEEWAVEHPKQPILPLEVWR